MKSETIDTVYKLQLEDHEIVFEMQGDMVNASRLGRPYGEEKCPFVWLDTEDAIVLGELMTIIKGCKPNELVRIEKDGAQTTVWMEMGLALGYASWLLPSFRKWFGKHLDQMNKRIDSQHDCRTSEKSETSEADEDEERHIVVIGFHHSGKLPS